jgi:hypothetical protein
MGGTFRAGHVVLRRVLKLNAHMTLALFSRSSLSSVIQIVKHVQTKENSIFVTAPAMLELI